MKTVIGIAAASFLGAVARYMIGEALPAGNGTAFPWATFLINLTGSFLLGLVIGRASRGRMPEWLRESLGTGFLGAYTTFSAFNGQLWQLGEHHAYFVAAVYMLLSATVGWALAAGGLRLGKGAAA